MRTEIRGSIWFSFYRFLILFPLIIGVVFRPPGSGRGFVVSFAVACGYVGLAMVALEFSLVARLRQVAGAFGQDALQQFHKQMGYVSTIFLLAHPILLFTNGYPVEPLNPFSPATPWAWRWGTIAFYVLLVLVGLSAGRRLLRMSYDWWQLTHRLLAPLVLVLALAHIFMINGFTGTIPMQALWATYGAGLLGVLAKFPHRLSPYLHAAADLAAPVERGAKRKGVCVTFRWKDYARGGKQSQIRPPTVPNTSGFHEPSCRRWPDTRNAGKHRDARPGQLCGSVEWHERL